MKNIDSRYSSFSQSWYPAKKYTVGWLVHMSIAQRFKDSTFQSNGKWLYVLWLEFEGYFKNM